jgi:hypothetical protein
MIDRQATSDILLELLLLISCFLRNKVSLTTRLLTITGSRDGPRPIFPLPIFTLRVNRNSVRTKRFANNRLEVQFPKCSAFNLQQCGKRWSETESDSQWFAVSVRLLVLWTIGVPDVKPMIWHGLVDGVRLFVLISQSKSGSIKAIVFSTWHPLIGKSLLWLGSYYVDRGVGELIVRACLITVNVTNQDNQIIRKSLISKC